MRRTAVVLLVTLLAPVTLAPPVPAAERGSSIAQSEYQTEILAATNRHRVEHLRVPLHGQRCVQRYAVRQAQRMANRDRMFHQHLGPILRECGLTLVGENVAYGYASGTSAVDDGWMHSAGHRANILDRRFRLLGMGARKSADGTWYASQVFGRR